jgi:hypothetical protein
MGGFVSSDAQGDPVSSGGVEREELGPLAAQGNPPSLRSTIIAFDTTTPY